MKNIIALLLLTLATLLVGCSTVDKSIKKLATTLTELDQLGLKEVSIPGRVTYTRYIREGNMSTLTHTNPSLSGPIVIVREHLVAK